MNPIIIKIKRSSIIKNPDAGRQDYHIPCPPQITVEMPWEDKDNPPEYLPGAILTSWKMSITPRGSTSVCTFFLKEMPDEKVVMKLSKKHGSLFSIIVDTPYQNIHSLIGEPDWHFRYEDTEVKCSRCKHKFSHEDFESDSRDYYDGYDENIEFSDTCCPNCGKWDCCEIEYEEINDVMPKVSYASADK